MSRTYIPTFLIVTIALLSFFSCSNPTAELNETPSTVTEEVYSINPEIVAPPEVEDNINTYDFKGYIFY